MELSSMWRNVTWGPGGFADNRLHSNWRNAFSRTCYCVGMDFSIWGFSAGISSGKAKFLHYLGLDCCSAWILHCYTEGVSELSGQDCSWHCSQVWLFQERFKCWLCPHCNHTEVLYGWGWGSYLFMSDDQFVPLKHASQYLWPFFISQSNIRYYSSSS